MKKFLSMVLALAMAMSLVTFAAPAAGAKDFTDNSSIQYKEAVDVISAIQIMDGYADASFNPSGTLTRGAAAKIICNMILGPTTAAALPTSGNPFPDVASGSTFAGYIAYCADHSIISGYADGDFRPADSLSGYAFLKMLLCALGYDQEIEGYQGANWRVNVAKQALGIGLDDGLNGDLDGSRIVTREEAALYAFNTLQSDLVEYDSKTTVAVNGATVTVGGNNFKSKTDRSQNSAFNNIDNGAIAGAGNIIQFAEEYFNRLERFPKRNNDFTGEGDSFGRPSTKWVWKGVEIGTYKVTPAQTYYGNVGVTKIYSDLALSGTAECANVFLNGEYVFSIDIKRSNGDDLFSAGDQKEAYLATVTGAGANISYTKPNNPVFLRDTAALGGLYGPVYNTYKDACEKVGDGTRIEVFHNDVDNKVIICAASIYPGEVDSTHGASSTKDAYVVLTEKKAGNPTNDNTFSKSGHDEFETSESFDEEDVVWFTYSVKEHEIGEVHKMEAVEGALNRRVNEKSVTLDNVVYKFGEEYAIDLNSEADLTNTSSYIVYRDANGWVLWLEEADFAVSRYAVIQRISVATTGTGTVSRSLDKDGNPVNGDGSDWDDSRVRLLLSNGTERNYYLDEAKRYRGTQGNADSVNLGATVPAGSDSIKRIYDAGQVIRFTENSDGTVRLYSITSTGNAKTASTAINPAGTNFYIRDHEMHNLFRNDGTPVTADSETIFVIKDPDGIKTYTGKRNAPDVNSTMANNVSAYAYINTNNTKPVAKLVYVIVDNSNKVENASKDITFLTKPSDEFLADTGDAYYEYMAVIKGVIQTEPVYVYSNTRLVGAKEDSTYDTDGSAPSVLTGNDYKTGSIILNKTTYDSDDFMTEGSFAGKSLKSDVAQGIKKTSRSDEIELDTHGKDGKHTEVVASGVNVFYVKDDAITRISISEIRNDTDDMVYYTTDDDGDITNLFIVDYEDDDTYIASARLDAITPAAGTTPASAIITYKWNTDDSSDFRGWYGSTAGKLDDQLNDLAKALNMSGTVNSARYVAAPIKDAGTLYVIPKGSTVEIAIFADDVTFAKTVADYNAQ